MCLEIPLDVLEHIGVTPEDHQKAKAAPQPPPPPPASHVGDKYQFRQPDGSANNIHNEHLGRAGCPFARSVRTEPKAHQPQPDGEELLNALMHGCHKLNTTGISQLVHYYTALIGYDIFHQNAQDFNINDTSSYLDLSPLYGRNQEEQNSVRTFENGLLKKDAYADTRPSIPPVVMVLLVMYNRFHNFAAQTILAINERGRFTPPSDVDKKKWLDEHIFQTARAITIGLYVNIILNDFIRAVTNTPIKNTDGKDPRITLHDYCDKLGLPKGDGNQVTVELNLLYRQYSCTSRTDTIWLQESYQELFPEKDPADLSVQELIKALDEHGQAHPSDPSQRSFGKLKRGEDGAFADATLVEILVTAIESPAGLFGINVAPEAYMPIALAGIEQARKWHAPSLNEFRKFLKLAPFSKFEDIHSDPDVAKRLKNLYGDVDHVELYPGVYFEEQKENSPGLSTSVRGLLTSALNLVRGDRFTTHDYKPENLTAWGKREIAPDYTILGGAKIFLLILNAFGSYIAFNSTYAMLPFFTPPRAKEIVEHLGIADLFIFTPPTGIPTPPPVPFFLYSEVRAVLGDQQHFFVPWAPHMRSLSTFMLASDTPTAAKQKKDVAEALYTQPHDALKHFEEYAMKITAELLAKKSHQIGIGANARSQVDIVRDVANLAATHFVAKLAWLPLNSPTGPSYTEQELNKLLNDVFIYIFADSDGTKSWAVRRDGDEPCAALVKAMEARLQHLIDNPKVAEAYSNDPLEQWGVNLAKRLLATGRPRREVAEILSGIGVGFVANAGMLIAQMVDFYLTDGNAKLWADIKALASKPSTVNDAKLQGYVLEGYRLGNTLALLRVAGPGVDLKVTQPDGSKRAIVPGNVIFLSLLAASRDPFAFPNPTEVKLDRPVDSYIHYGYGPHQCLGKSLNMVYARGILKVVSQLPELKRAEGYEGKLNYTSSASGLKNYLSEDWSTLSPLPFTMKLEWQARPKTYPMHSRE